VSAISIVLVDTNVIIEAVRTECWPAITGGLHVETVAACREEALARPPDAASAYVPVGTSDLRRLRNIHYVSDIAQATFRLAYADAHGLDRGEHDLLTHMYVSDSGDLVLCSPDKAAVRAAVLLGLGDHLRSLDDLLQAVGTRPRKPLRRQFTSAWLRSFRTKVLLEEP
jgi:hypothetical protein